MTASQTDAQVSPGMAGLGPVDETIDLAALRARYPHERDERLRRDGRGQYQTPTGDFGYYHGDPYADPERTGPPITGHREVLIVGGGFGGILAGVRLRDEGFESIGILGKGGDFGGTWYWNRYPGVRCDIESLVYMPLLEEIGTSPASATAAGRRSSATPRPSRRSTTSTGTPTSAAT